MHTKEPTDTLLRGEGITFRTHELTDIPNIRSRGGRNNICYMRTNRRTKSASEQLYSVQCWIVVPADQGEDN